MQISYVARPHKTPAVAPLNGVVIEWYTKASHHMGCWPGLQGIAKTTTAKLRLGYFGRLKRSVSNVYCGKPIATPAGISPIKVYQ